MAFARSSGHLIAAGVIGLALACSRPAGESPSEAGGSDPCADGPKLEVAVLPATYAVQLGDRALAKLEIADVGEPRLTAAPDAPPASVAAFEALLAAAAGRPAVEFTWSKETRGGETHGCTREVSKGDPGYVSALARHLDGKRIEAGIVQLRREPGAN